MKEINVGSKPKQVIKPAVPKISYKQSFISKLIAVIVDDIRSKFREAEAVVDETPEGWEEYKRFRELAKKGMK